ncbi:MAG: family 43 glycosylhydrolase [Propionicimonas sp.]|uniref:family 43 glycosylhydrolase n=1 Tax=Propionicimonas sp. TaxID=1955623 RepID=UPI003D144B4C
MFALPDSWVWDFWTADDGERYHLFFLFASRALHDPDARHFRAGIGHAVSTDLTTWTRVEDALVHGEAGTFDDVATWTGSVIRHPDGTWYLFYTGTSFAASGSNMQRVGLATSPDLFTWTRQGMVAEADPRWYEELDGGWNDWAFRDPWVFADPGGDGWHLLVTARGSTGPIDDRGVAGHCWSPDLRTWEVRPPASEVGQGFGQLEVMHTVEVDGQWFLLFSCLGKDVSDARKGTTPGGSWAARADGPLGPFDLAGAEVISPPGLYVGRLVQLRDTGEWRFLAFVDQEPDGSFGGRIIDPLPVRVEDGRLVVG